MVGALETLVELNCRGDGQGVVSRLVLELVSTFQDRHIGREAENNWIKNRHLCGNSRGSQSSCNISADLQSVVPLEAEIADRRG